jgi:hypothetical protein
VIGNFPVIKSEGIFPGNIFEIFNKFPKNWNFYYKFENSSRQVKIKLFSIQALPKYNYGLLMFSDFEALT